MTRTAGGHPQEVPKIELTPLENTLKTLLLDVALYIRECDKAKGLETPTTVLRFTGGWVRDKLLGAESHDIDVAINTMTGYQFGNYLKNYLDNPDNLRKYKENHENGELQDAIIKLHKIEANPEKSKHLETVTTKIFGFEVDLVNLRKETYSEVSRTPQMEFGTEVEDALRRDATINSLFYNLNESKIEDLTERGLNDLKDKIIRTPLEPYQTFKDDPLRVLRLIRFASRLGYRLDRDTEEAMRHDDIQSALKLKISRERVLTEVEKMIRGPDPRGALHIIDRLNLYQTIFTNQQDGVVADTSSWSLAYDALYRMLSPNEESEAIRHVRALLVRDQLERYYAWMITASAPWSSVPTRVQTGGNGKPLPPRMAEVARDSLRADNKLITLLTQAANNWRSILDFKTAFVEGHTRGTPAEIRQQVGLQIRSWQKNWRLCILLSLLQEIMQGRDFVQGAVVVQSYEKFLSYIVEQGLEDVCDLKPIVNGDEIMKALEAKKGPWLSKVLNLAIEWQLLHPENQDKQAALEELKSMEKLRNAAREALRQSTSPFIPDPVLSNITINGFDQLWQEISSQNDLDHSKICENLLVAQGFLKIKAQAGLAEEDKATVNKLYEWTKQHESRQRSTLAVSVLSSLADALPIHEAADARDIIIALASFTVRTDAWTTDETFATSTALLEDFVEKCPPSSFWETVESTLKARIKPFFAKSKNPAITAAGRKNFHPIPLPRFDLSILDPETKPWKTSDVYITTAFFWVVKQYRSTDRNYLEAHFPLLVPLILTLIDDENTTFKHLGCVLLIQLLNPIHESRSDILRRTNLSSVFEDAIRPSFHSLPTITPEDESIVLLGAAYPALRSLLQTSYRQSSPPASPIPKDEETFVAATTKTLRDHLIPSFHHIGSTNTTSGSTFASFPHPRLSTLLLNQIAITCADLAIHTTKYLQDIVPLLYSTLSNPFGTAHPPLLLAATATARAVILNAYPRLWRWRGELMSAICSCWLHIIEDEEESKISEQDEAQAQTDLLNKVKKELQGSVYLLKYALENPANQDDTDQQEAMAGFAQELQMLVDADGTLKECLFADVNPDDPGFFGLDS
ncbi:hypothetical protein BJX61DRAFT_531480 [Aspergillus egyptiacus]|nr:hypothetical protein BJX61DRAFT_531480 [Aspergillus egyptiacus]